MSSAVSQGTFTALITPFRPDGSLDLDTLAELVEWQIKCGVDGLVPAGSTGEAATLTPEEHVAVVHRVVDVAGGAVANAAGAAEPACSAAPPIVAPTAARQLGRRSEDHRPRAVVVPSPTSSPGLNDAASAWNRREPTPRRTTRVPRRDPRRLGAARRPPAPVQPVA